VMIYLRHHRNVQLGAFASRHALIHGMCTVTRCANLPTYAVHGSHHVWRLDPRFNLHKGGDLPGTFVKACLMPPHEQRWPCSTSSRAQVHIYSEPRPVQGSLVPDCWYNCQTCPPASHRGRTVLVPQRTVLRCHAQSVTQDLHALGGSLMMRTFSSVLCQLLSPIGLHVGRRPAWWRSCDQAASSWHTLDRLTSTNSQTTTVLSARLESL
jgi:hypothetical protein